MSSQHGTVLLKVPSLVYTATDHQQVTLLGAGIAGPQCGVGLCRQRHFATSAVLQVRHLWIGFQVDSIIFAQLVTAGVLQRMSLCWAAVAFWSPIMVVLDPLPFLLYNIKLHDVTSECGFTGHAYANNTQCMSARQSPTMLMRRINWWGVWRRSEAPRLDS